jgi:hypothetical protein
VSSTGVPTTAPPPIDSITVTEAKDVNPANDVSPVPNTTAQTAEPIGSVSTAIVSVPLLVSAEAPKTQLTPEVLVPVPTESIPAVKTATMDLTDDQDDIDSPLAGVTLADDDLDASTRPMGRYYYFLVFSPRPIIQSLFLMLFILVFCFRSTWYYVFDLALAVYQF